MKKISLAFSLLAVLLLSGCANKTTENTAKMPVGGMDMAPQEEARAGASANVGYIDFEAIIVTEQNFNELNAEFSGKLSKTAIDSSTQIALIMNNHRENLSAFNYEELATLDGAAAQSWQQFSERMGGHHVGGVLTFPKADNPQLLVITGLPVGDVILTF